MDSLEHLPDPDKSDPVVSRLRDLTITLGYLQRVLSMGVLSPGQAETLGHIVHALTCDHAYYSDLHADQVEERTIRARMLSNLEAS